jgi:hypothetical protein
MRMGVVLEAVKARDVKRAVPAASTRCDQLDLSFDFDRYAKEPLPPRMRTQGKGKARPGGSCSGWAITKPSSTRRSSEAAPMD